MTLTSRTVATAGAKSSASSDEAEWKEMAQEADTLKKEMDQHAKDISSARERLQDLVDRVSAQNGDIDTRYKGMDAFDYIDTGGHAESLKNTTMRGQLHELVERVESLANITAQYQAKADQWEKTAHRVPAKNADKAQPKKAGKYHSASH